MITSIPEREIKRLTDIKTNSSVYIGNRKFILGKEKGGGGEGAIFSIKGMPDAVAKIYFQSACTERRRAKIEKIISLNIWNPRIAVPFKAIRDCNNVFIGYAMPLAVGKSLQDRIYTKKGFDGWSRKNLVELCLSMMNIIRDVYSVPGHRILIGDINLGNFIINAPDNICLVDFDSIQIDDFPCPVGVDDFTPPELLREHENRKNLLRDYNNEAFSIAVLLFRVLCNNQNPFSCRNGATPADNILNSKFPYNADGTATEDVPKGYWSCYWAALPDYIRKAFVQSFTTEKRTLVGEWITLLGRYLNEFDRIISRSPFLNELIITKYPNDFDPGKDNRCICCNSIVPPSMLSQGLCFDCIKAGVELIRKSCRHCHHVYTYVYKPGTRVKNEDYCPDCLAPVPVVCDCCGKKAHVHKYLVDSFRHEGKVLCTDCWKRYESIKKKIGEYKKPASDIKIFTSIDFEAEFDKVKEFCRESSDFLQTFGTDSARKLLEDLAFLFWAYYAQSIGLGEYQKVLSERMELSSTKEYHSVLRRLSELNNKAKGDIRISDDKNISVRLLPYGSLIPDLCNEKRQKIVEAYNAIVSGITSSGDALLCKYDTEFVHGKDINSDKLIDLSDKMRREAERIGLKLDSYNDSTVIRCYENCKDGADKISRFLSFYSGCDDIFLNRDCPSAADAETAKGFLESKKALVSDYLLNQIDPYAIACERIDSYIDALDALDTIYSSYKQMTRDKLAAALPNLENAIYKIRNSCASFRSSDFIAYYMPQFIDNARDYINSDGSSQSSIMEICSNLMSSISNIDENPLYKEISEERDSLYEAAREEERQKKAAARMDEAVEIFKKIVIGIFIAGGIALGIYLLFWIILPFLWNLFLSILKIALIAGLIIGGIALLAMIFGDR